MNAALIHAATNPSQDPSKPAKRYSTGCNNNAEDAHAWHHTAISATAFTLSAIVAYVATEAIYKSVLNRN